MIRKRKRTIITNNKEIYKKLNELHFTSHIVLEDAKRMQVKRIVNNINKNNKVLLIDIKEGYIVIKKLKPLNFNIYLRKIVS